MPHIDTLAVAALVVLVAIVGIQAVVDRHTRRRFREELARAHADNDRLRAEVARAERDAADAQCELDAMYEGATEAGTLYTHCVACDRAVPYEEAVRHGNRWRCPACPAPLDDAQG